MCDVYCNNYESSKFLTVFSLSVCTCVRTNTVNMHVGKACQCYLGKSGCTPESVIHASVFRYYCLSVARKQIILSKCRQFFRPYWLLLELFIDTVLSCHPLVCLLNGSLLRRFQIELCQTLPLFEVALSILDNEIINSSLWNLSTCSPSFTVFFFLQQFWKLTKF